MQTLQLTLETVSQRLYMQHDVVFFDATGWGEACHFGPRVVLRNVYSLIMHLKKNGGVYYCSTLTSVWAISRMSWRVVVSQAKTELRPCSSCAGSHT